jgi:hypothetical protein
MLPLRELMRQVLTLTVRTLCCVTPSKPQTLAEAVDAASLWEAAAALLLHPHLWVRKAAGRLIGHYLSRCDATGRWAGGGTEAGAGMLAPEGKLMTLARAVCQQVRGCVWEASYLSASP